MSTYQAFVAPISDTFARYAAWANFFGGGFTTCGWQAQTGHGEVVASGTGATYAWTNVAAAPTTALNLQQTYRFNGAFVPSNTYTGGNTINGSTITDIVTYSGQTYVHITASSSAATVPSSDTTNWQPYVFEIWKSNGSQSSSNPIYVKIVYTVASTGNTGPAMQWSIGTGVDANGQITGNLLLGSAAPQYGAPVAEASAGSLTVFECDFAGDADNFRFIFQRGNTVATGWTWSLVVDRAKTASGGDSDAYTYIAAIWPYTFSSRTFSCVLLKSTLGVPINPVSYAAGWSGFVSNANQTTTMLQFGTTPVFPVFPTVGYLANPCLGVVLFNAFDVTDGAVMPVWIYGASHPYLVNKNGSGTAAQTPTDFIGAQVMAIRWE